MAIMANMESIRQVMSALPKMADYRISGITVGSSSLTQAVVKVLTDRERLREATPCEVFACYRCERGRFYITALSPFADEIFSPIPGTAPKIWEEEISVTVSLCRNQSLMGCGP